MFSLLLEVADKSLKVADSAIHDTCCGGCDRGQCRSYPRNPYNLKKVSVILLGILGLLGYVKEKSHLWFKSLVLLLEKGVVFTGSRGVWKHKRHLQIHGSLKSCYLRFYNFSTLLGK